MKKLVKRVGITSLSLLGFACLSLGFAACDRSGNPNGYSETYSSSEQSSSHTHTLTYVAEKAATCGQDGHVEHWHCSGCEKDYLDAEGNGRGTITIKATGEHYYDNGVCLGCGFELAPTEGLEFAVTDGGYKVTGKGEGNADVEHIGIPATYNGQPVVEIGAEAFKEDTSQKSVVKSISIPDSVTKICEKAFNGCYNLKIICLPKSLKTVEEYGFNQTGIKRCEYTGTIAEWTQIDFEGTSANPTGSEGLYIGGERVTEVVIPEGATAIKPYLFIGCGLTSVTLPSSLKSIGEGAFSGNALTSVTLPSSLESIGKSAFSSNALTSLSIPASVDTIGMRAFARNDFVELTFPSGTSVGYGAFEYCWKLRKVFINGGCSLDMYVFQECYALTSVELYNTSSINSWAFYGCYRLMEVGYNNAYDTAQSIKNDNKTVQNVYDLENGASKLTEENGFVIYDGSCMVDYIGESEDIVIAGKITKIIAYALSRYGKFELTSITFENTSGWTADGTPVDVTDPTANVQNWQTAKVYERS